MAQNKASPDLSVSIGGVNLPNPIMSAAGTAGYGAELAAFIDISRMGAMVMKSLAPFPWEGHGYPRVTEAPGGMLNGVGLQGPGIEKWIKEHLPALKEQGARVVASIWGRSPEEFKRSVELLEQVKQDLTALEINLSCPNMEGQVFAHSSSSIAEVLENTKTDIPRWVKLSPNLPNLTELALGARDAGADAVTLINTMPGMKIDAEKAAPHLASVSGGFSGPAMKPIALKAVYDCYGADSSLPIIGVGGIRKGSDVAEFLLAGARAVQIGTATFLNPRALKRILDDFHKWCRRHKVQNVADLVGGAHS